MSPRAMGCTILPSVVTTEYPRRWFSYVTPSIGSTPPSLSSPVGGRPHFIPERPPRFDDRSAQRGHRAPGAPGATRHLAIHSEPGRKVGFFCGVVPAFPRRGGGRRARLARPLPHAVPVRGARPRGRLGAGGDGGRAEARGSVKDPLTPPWWGAWGQCPGAAWPRPPRRGCR